MDPRTCEANRCNKPTEDDWLLILFQSEDQELLDSTRYCSAECAWMGLQEQPDDVPDYVVVWDPQFEANHDVIVAEYEDVERGQVHTSVRVDDAPAVTEALSIIDRATPPLSPN